MPTQINQYKLKLYCVRTLLTISVGWWFHVMVCTPTYGLPLSRVVSDVTDLLEQAKNMHHSPVLLIFLHFRGWDVFIK